MNNIIDFVVIGFPKCGTTALIEKLEESSEINIGRKGIDNVEFDFINTKKEELDPHFFLPNVANGHKFAAYIFDVNKLKALLARV